MEQPTGAFIWYSIKACNYQNVGNELIFYYLNYSSIYSLVFFLFYFIKPKFFLR